MSLTFGFYNSVEGDRLYDAEQFGRIFDGIILDGVFKSIGDVFAVSANSGMTISVGTGRAWFDHTWTLNDSNIYLTVPNSGAHLRIDSVVLETNQDTRANSIKVISGIEGSASAPELTNTAFIKQYRICNIEVEAGVTSIQQDDIISTIGTNECPYARVVADTAGSYVTRFNGQTGDITGVTSVNGRSGDVQSVASFNGQTGDITGVGSINGQSGDITGIATETYVNTAINNAILAAMSFDY